MGSWLIGVDIFTIFINFKHIKYSFFKRNRLNIKLNGYDYDKKFVFSEVGYNFEPSEIGASFGLVQLKNLKSFNKIRNSNFKSHCEFFKKRNELFIIPKVSRNVKTNFLAYPIIIKKNMILDYLNQTLIFLRRVWNILFKIQIQKHIIITMAKQNPKYLLIYLNHFLKEKCERTF